MKIIILVIIGGCLGYFAGLEFLEKPGNTESATEDRVVPAAPNTTREPQTRMSPWSGLLGFSLREYAGNLRRIACPEETIYDIAFFKLLREANAKLAPNLQKSVPALQARQKEIGRKIREAGISFPEERTDFFLSEKQLELARTSVQMYRPAVNDTNAAQRRAMLGGFNNEQMIYYKSEFELYGPTIVRTLAGFRPSQAEYYAMVSAMDKNTSQDLKEKLPGLLTPDRYREFQATQNPINIGVYAFCEQNPGLRAKMPQLIELLNARTNLSTAQFREKALVLVGPELFDNFFRMESQQYDAAFP